MRPIGSLNVQELTVVELGTIIYGSDCPIARLVCIDELDRRRFSQGSAGRGMPRQRLARQGRA